MGLFCFQIQAEPDVLHFDYLVAFLCSLNRREMNRQAAEIFPCYLYIVPADEWYFFLLKYLLW